jgi:DNA mismatch repair protein MutL
MNKIKQLSKLVVEQIAAGEVVERPASIIKELLENSIDAGASRVDIVADSGGLSRIKISDNGSGIEKDELILAVTRHATSKIEKADDLYSIGTMGFRGEALASSSAVSRFLLSSSTIGDGMGWQIDVNGGEIGGLSPVQHLKGTTVECTDLFYNLPARKKFLKTERAEKMAISKVIQQVILAFPSIHFTGTLDGKKSYDFPAVDRSRTRIAQVAGSSMAAKLVHCRVETDDLCADLFISRPEEAQKQPRFKELFVNLRKIDNRSVIAAVNQGFSRFITSSLKPNWFLYLDINPAKIDVNVHPTKAEIKFDDEKSIFSLVYRLVQKSITDNRNSEFSAEPASDQETAYPTSNSITSFSEVSERKSVSIHSFPGTENFEQQKSVKYTNPNLGEVFQTNIPLISESTGSGTEERGVLAESVWDSIPCFQIHKRYIIAPVNEGMLLIDQHAAHERILYERVLNDLNIGGVDSQQLLFPTTIELSPVEKETLLTMREMFEKSGFEIQDFGGNTVAVSAVPATGFVKSTQVRDAIFEMLSQFEDEKAPEILSSLHRHFAASYACAAAIKFGKELPKEEMNSLLSSLFSCENSNICPHGRPTVTKITLQELSKRFLRE